MKAAITFAFGCALIAFAQIIDGAERGGKQHKRDGCGDSSFTPNGCSPRYLPYAYKRKFKPACDDHDRCYHFKCQSREGCDDSFLRDMNVICARQPSDKQDHCRTRAGRYYGIVRRFGESRYGK